MESRDATVTLQQLGVGKELSQMEEKPWGGALHPLWKSVTSEKLSAGSPAQLAATSPPTPYFPPSPTAVTFVLVLHLFPNTKDFFNKKHFKLLFKAIPQNRQEI